MKILKLVWKKRRQKATLGVIDNRFLTGKQWLDQTKTKKPRSKNQ